MRDRLFHTLDPTTRTLKLGGRPHLLTDTVGLHQQAAPPAGGRVRRRRSRRRAAPTCWLHVLDASAPEAHQEMMKRSVEETLEEIGAGERPRVLVLNKIDLLDENARDELRLRHPDAVLVSGVTGEGLAELADRLERELAHTLRPLDLLVPVHRRRQPGGAARARRRGQPRGHRRGRARARPRARQAGRALRPLRRRLLIERL